MSNTSKRVGRFHRFLSELGPGALLSAAAILAAFYISETPRFQRIGAVVSDEISRALGVYSNGPLVLLRLDREFSKADLQRLLARAIPALMDNYQAAALGVDIDLSRRDYDQLAKDFSDWSRQRPGPAGRIVWAVGYERGHERAPSEPGEIEACANCDATCIHRFRPKPIFGDEFDPPNYGLAYAWTDANGISRSSFRFGCHQDTTGQLTTFHFKLVEAYCGGNTQDDKCAKLKPYHQSITKLFSWYEAKVYDLCLLVQCSGADLGAPPEKPSSHLANKIPIIYSDVEGDDEHATIFGTRKGAEVVASLTMNELLYGESNHALLEVVKWTIEIMLAAILIVLFHWPPAEHWAVLVSGLLFVGYLFLAPRLSTWIPDFRNYVLAVMLAFGLEVWIKAVAQGWKEFRAKRNSTKSAAQPVHP